MQTENEGKFITKTRQQLVNLIVTHSRVAVCAFCDRELGYLTIIPCDIPNGARVLSACRECANVHIDKKARNFWVRVYALLKRNIEK